MVAYQVIATNSQLSVRHGREHCTFIIYHFSSQGFMYVFGGMQDSSYTNSKTPLWVFDTGIFYSVHVQWGSKMSESTRQCFNKKFYVL